MATGKKNGTGTQAQPSQVQQSPEFVEQNLRLSRLYKGEVNPRAVIAHAQGQHFVVKIVRDP